MLPRHPKLFNFYLCGLTCDEPGAGRTLALEWVVYKGQRDMNSPSPLPPHQDPEELKWSSNTVE